MTTHEFENYLVINNSGETFTTVEISDETLTASRQGDVLIFKLRAMGGVEIYVGGERMWEEIPHKES